MYLFIDTAKERSVIALTLPDKDKILKDSYLSKIKHSETLIPHVNNLVNKAKIDKDDIQGIVVVAGPGSYTGLRVGVATANALSYALKIPIWGINKLDIYAAIAKEKNMPECSICALLENINNLVYAALISGRGQRVEPSSYFVGTVSELKKLIARPTIFCGEASDDLQKRLKDYFGDKHLKFLPFDSDDNEIIKFAVNSSLVRKPEHIALPQYINPPKITTSKNNRLV